MALRALVTLIAVVALSGEVLAQSFPSKTVHIVVPFAPGGSADIAGRVLAEHLEKTLAQPVVVEDRPGGDTTLGTEYVARATPDGHTLLMVFPSFVINPSLRPLSFDPLKDFSAVSQIYFVPMVVAVHPSVPAKSLQELVVLARAKPGELSFGSSGRMHQLMGEMLKLDAKINIVHVPFQGSAPALNALVGGHIPMLYGNVTEVAPHAKAGRIRALAVTSRERADVLPDVPTMREAGFPELEAVNWSGLVVPASTPPAVVAQLNSEISGALRNPQVAAKLSNNGMTPAAGAREQFAAFLQSESSRYAKVVRESGIKAN